MTSLYTPIVVYRESQRTVVGRGEYFGLPSVDLVGPPRRLYGDGSPAPPLYESGIDALTVSNIPTPAQLFATLSSGDTWLSQSSRTLQKLSALFLVAEDPQGRLVARRAATLAHQVSLVRHIQRSPDLNRILIADEVGLGKTIEAGLLISGLLAQTPTLRVLYLAPARLVANVHREFRDKLELSFRRWSADGISDAYLPTDNLVVASIHRAVHPNNRDMLTRLPSWDVIVVDECHHLSARGEEGTDANQHYQLIRGLVNRLSENGRLILMSGTPHQGNRVRFENLVSLLRARGESRQEIRGRVVFRTKEDVRDWRGEPLFPKRHVFSPTIVTLGDDYRRWYDAIADLYDTEGQGARARARGWAKGQALQWAASSVQAGLGFLSRLAIRRLQWGLEHTSLGAALAALRPYKGGSPGESIDSVLERMRSEVARQLRQMDIEDMEDLEEDPWRPDERLLESLLDAGTGLLRSPAATAKWETLCTILADAPHEKAVLFAQPVETVTSLVEFLARRFGARPAVIVGGQTDAERDREIGAFREPDGPRFLVSSRAGGEGINLQVARRLIHLDVPWNPMELEQRVGRVHRFGSLQTVLVHSLVVQGTREVDAYRVARDKLRVAFGDLARDPERFETLYSRVMSLIPPQQLEDVLGKAPPGPITGPTEVALGDLIEQGLHRWREFHAEFAQQQSAIAALSPGAAAWEDLATFLREFHDAEAARGFCVPAFEEVNEEVVSRRVEVPALKLDGVVYACADTAGMAARDTDGREAPPLGLNTPSVTSVLRASVSPTKPTGAAWLRPREGGVAAFDASLPGSVMRPFGLAGLLRQTLRLESGNAVERGVELHLFVLPAEGDSTELSSDQRGAVVRTLLTAARIQTPPLASDWPQRLLTFEQEALNRLARPTPDEFRDGIRHAVWPVISCVVL